MTQILLLIIALLLALILLAIMALFAEQRKFEREAREWRETHEKWLFNQLYTIDRAVLRPEEKPREESNKVTIYNWSEDPQREFEGNLEDY